MNIGTRTDHAALHWSWQGRVKRRLIVHLVFAASILIPRCVVAQNGVVQINQSTVAASGNRATNGFPYIIGQSGSYQLTSNLVVPADVSGIEIVADNVTLDLNGFTISGPVQCTGSSGATLSCTPSATNSAGVSNATGANITIRNGSVVGFGIGVVLAGLGTLIEEIHSSSNTSFGIIINYGVLRRSTAIRNGVGIVATGSTVTENLAASNIGAGLTTAAGGVYGTNTFLFNGTPVVSLDSLSQNNNACGGVAC